MTDKEKSELEHLKKDCEECGCGPGTSCCNCLNFYTIAKLEGRPAI